MANWQLNKIVKNRQIRTLLVVGFGFVLIIIAVITLLIEPHPKKTKSLKDKVDLTGIVDESFLDAASDNALTAQQAELELLKKQISTLTQNINTMRDEHQRQLQQQKEEIASELTTLSLANQQTQNVNQQNKEYFALKNSASPTPMENPNTYAMNDGKSLSDASLQVNMVSFRPRSITKHKKDFHLNPAHYVPSNTSVRAVILGGADADASVNGQSKNNGVMLFKFLEDGTLPNGWRSRLKGCRVSANSYGDISSERAFATLYRLSCVHKGLPIIDKEVTGWVFFNGKVGIKGQPLMRDNKVMTWAGVSGALSGIAQAAQYAQSMQAVGPYGATSVVPSSQIAPFAAYGGASKAADTLSQYYVQRAEQYHPVIQVGAGNVVTVVFKDGFYLEPDNSAEEHIKQRAIDEEQGETSNEESSSHMNFTVPPEVLGKIDRANSLAGGLQ